MGKGQERQAPGPAPVPTQGWGDTTEHPELCRALQHQLPTQLNSQSRQALLLPISCTSFPALQRVTDIKRIFANKLGLDLQLPCASEGCAQHSVVSATLAQLNSALILLPLARPSRSFHVRKTQMGKRAWKGQSEISSQGETPSQGDTQGTAKPGLLEGLKCFSGLTCHSKGVPGSRSQTPSDRTLR